jgi:hypothetical protein
MNLFQLLLSVLIFYIAIFCVFDNFLLTKLDRYLDARKGSDVSRRVK